jgi:hypothetical protein
LTKKTLIAYTTSVATKRFTLFKTLILGSITIFGGCSALVMLITSCGGGDKTDKRIDLHDVITNVNIGVINSQNNESVKAAVELANPGFILELEQITIDYSEGDTEL